MFVFFFCFFFADLCDVHVISFGGKTYLMLFLCADIFLAQRSRQSNLWIRCAIPFHKQQEWRNYADPCLVTYYGCLETPAQKSLEFCSDMVQQLLGMKELALNNKLCADLKNVGLRDQRSGLGLRLLRTKRKDRIAWNKELNAAVGCSKII